jgi:UDP-glucose 4-epimerase
MWVQPKSPYGASKLSAEAFAIAYADTYQIPVLALRFFNVYGPFQRHDHDYSAVIPKFVSWALDDVDIEVYGDGNQKRDFTHVDSVSSVITSAIVKRSHSERPVNLAFGTSITLNETLQTLEEILGRPIKRTYLSSRVGDIVESQSNPERLLALFPEAAPIPFMDGLRSVFKWIEAVRGVN